jgi:hypothetical protein
MRGRKETIEDQTGAAISLNTDIDWVEADAE